MQSVITEMALKQTYQAIYAASRIAVIPHRSPDGDAIGAALSISHVIGQYGKHIDLICIDKPPKNTHFLPGIEKFTQNLQPNTYDLLIFVDCGSSHMSKFHEGYPDLFSGKYQILNIDHHSSNDNFGTINLVDSTAASTTQILFEIFTRWQFPISQEAATCLLTGLHFDTGSFKHNNTTPRVLRIAAQLSRLGADNQKISRELFKQSNAKQLKLWGRVLQNAKRTPKNIVTSAVSKKDYQETNTSSKDLEGIVDYLNSVPESKFSVLLSDDQKGGVKGSLRTQDDQADLSEIANIFGGGGHKMASGFRIEGELNEEKYWSIN